MVMAATPGSPSRDSMVRLNRKVVTAADNWPTSSEEPFQALSPKTPQRGFGAVKDKPPWFRAKKINPAMAGIR